MQPLQVWMAAGLPQMSERPTIRSTLSVVEEDLNQTDQIVHSTRREGPQSARQRSALKSLTHREMLLNPRCNALGR